jgi:hypothetical protein
VGGLNNDSDSIRMRVNNSKHYTESARIQDIIQMHSTLEVHGGGDELLAYDD